ncbi:myelin-oligodendrocyte glycoprotein-like [Vombatus ursinus]|uniref:Ig-like domain-containing protein n=1 Tax=Vombatus ursinus TaxID=29139 RepID=A0A4X2M4A9_VOMUR|nr:myelin-oligodendrocyte glycoprotein-like [Vombatus ursinus]
MNISWSGWGILKGSSGSSLHKGNMVSFQDVMEILYPLGACLCNSLIAFFLLLMMPKMTLGQFSVIGPAGPIQASLGGEAELPCYLSPRQNAQHMEVVWFHSTWVVHLYQDGEDQFGDQDPDYRGRTELVRDAITSGNVTLKILNVRFSDAGKYMCLIADGFHQEQAEMELKVSGDEPLESPTTLPVSFILIYFILLHLPCSVLTLLCQGCFFRSVSWLCEINGLLAVTSAFEVEMILCYLWLWHRCQGYLHEERLFSYGSQVMVILAVLLILRIVSVYLLRRLLPQRSPELTIR